MREQSGTPGSNVPGKFLQSLRLSLPSCTRFDADTTRAALLGSLGFGYLVLPPLLACTAATRIGLPQTGAAAQSVEYWANLALWIAAGTLASLLTWWLLRWRPPLPVGHVLRAADAPELFQAIDGILREFPGPVLGRPAKLHRVCLTDAAELEIVRTPRWGLPLGFVNTLAIGLPAMQTMTPKQFQVALARKLGQLSRRDHAMAGYAYHLRQTWTCYATAAGAGPAALRWFLKAFFAWYAPWYRRASAPAARAYERAGDEYALQLLHHEDVSDAIVAMTVNAAFLHDKFWPAIESLCGRLPAPRHLPYASLEQAHVKGVKPAAREAWLRNALHARPRADAASPTLRERIQDLDWSHVPPTPPTENAARRLLGAAFDSVCSAMDRIWMDANEPKWRARFHAYQQAKPRLESLRSKASAAGLAQPELREYLRLTRKYLRGPSAAASYRCVLSRHGRDAKLHFLIGRRLLEQQNAAGLKILERAMELDERYARPACKLISQFRLRQCA